MDLRENPISGKSVAATEAQANPVPSNADESISERSRGDAETMLEVVDAGGLTMRFGPMADRSRPSRRRTGRLDFEKNENAVGGGDMRIAGRGALRCSAGMRASLRRTVVLALGNARKIFAIAPPTPSADYRVSCGSRNGLSYGRLAQGFPATNSEGCKSNGIDA